MDHRAQLLDVGEMVVNFAVTTLFVFAVVGFDERRLTAEQQERAWPTASKRAALVVFGAIALPLHFLRTRRSLKGVALAIGSLIGLFAVDALLGLGFESVFRP